MNQPPPIKTRIRRVMPKKPVYCYICDSHAKHPYWDPESNGHVCRDCLSPCLISEAVLINTKGICRPKP